MWLSLDIDCIPGGEQAMPQKGTRPLVTLCSSALHIN